MWIGICDDKEKTLEAVKQECLKYFSEDTVITLYLSAEACLDDLSAKGQIPDLFILDVEMGGMNGIDLAHVLQERYCQCSIIYLTSHLEVIQDAFGRGVIGFVLKDRMGPSLTEKLEQFYKERIANTEITLKDEDFTVRKGDIVCIRADHVYTSLIMAVGMDGSGRILTASRLLRYSLDSWQQLLDEEDFFRIHKSCMIHFAYVKGEPVNQKVCLLDGTEHKVSRSRWKNLKLAYRDYCRRKAISI